MCTCIDFVDISSFDGEEMPEPPHDSSVDPDDDKDMVDAKDHDQDEAGAERHPPSRALVPPFSRCGRLETRYRMELGNKLSALFVEAGIKPSH